MAIGLRSHAQSRPGSRLRSMVGAAALGTLLIGTGGSAVLAQDASPEASPMASPIAIATWIDMVAVEAEATIDGDSSSVGVVLGEIAEINVAAIEVRPYIILQTANNTDSDMMAAVFMVPEGMDPASFVFPASEADLPEGVTAVGGYVVSAGMQTAAVFTDLTPGSYVLATDTGLSVPFTVTEVVPLEVPDLFATPEG
jgi:hypothetical protein